MALERVLSSSYTTRSSVFLLQNPFSNPQILSLSPKKNFNLLGFSRRRFNCSVQYSRNDYNNDVHEAASVAYPKPEEIQWRKELSNSVHLIGVVGVPVEIKHLPSGKVLSWTRLAVKKSASETSWISLTFWDELAHIAFQHVQKGHQIYVSGRLVSDTAENNDGKQQTYYKVVVQQLNFVEKSLSSFSIHDHESNSMTAGRKLPNNAANGTETTQELWQAFFANPVDWWDNRKTKRNPKYPDFKHKDTGEALWVEGRNNPPWVKNQLALLDTRMESFTDNRDRRMHANSLFGDSF